jgi:hypothetical protein
VKQAGGSQNPGLRGLCRGAGGAERFLPGAPGQGKLGIRWACRPFPWQTATPNTPDIVMLFRLRDRNTMATAVYARYVSSLLAPLNRRGRVL